VGILGSIAEVMKGLKHKKPMPRVCPVCTSPKIRLSSRFDAWLMPATYICPDCGYKGPIVMELERNEEEGA